MPTDELHLLNLTLPSAAENLACDEALLDWGEETGGEVLRFWEPTTHFVVVGYANRVATEVIPSACAEEGVGLYRRCTGGGTVLQGPGCLNYSLVLQIPAAGPLASISGTNHFVMERHRAAVEGLLATQAKGSRFASGRVEMRGHTDLAIGGRKFSGNAQRRKRRALLFHGSFLLGLDLALMSRVLNFPSRQPDYRRHRRHLDFLVNLPLSPALLKERLQQVWQAHLPLAAWPEEAVQRLVAEKYETAAWNLKLP
jgi:lipoate---protein ligase